MSKEIKYTLTDKQVEALEKMYNENKSKLNSEIDSFEKYINFTIDLAIDSHIQFTSMNEKMMDMFDSTINSMNGTPNFDMNNIDEFINNIFNNTSSTHMEKKKSNNSDNSTLSNKDKTSKIKN